MLGMLCVSVLALVSRDLGFYNEGTRLTIRVFKGLVCQTF